MNYTRAVSHPDIVTDSLQFLYDVSKGIAVFGRMCVDVFEAIKRDFIYSEP